MSNVPMLRTDEFIVVNKTIFDSTDYKILSYLYQPLIGSIAINLYLTLWAYLEKQQIISAEWTHLHLMNNMQIDLEKIITARLSLEAIGLLKTYIKEGDNSNKYVYELYSPLKANEFLKDPFLSTVLHDTLGDKDYKRICDYFKLPTINMSGYKDITTNFNDVFNIANVSSLEKIDEYKKRNSRGYSFEPTIDLNSILAGIPKEVLNHRTITKDMKELIYKLALVYNYDDATMEKLIYDSIDGSHRIDSSMLRMRARKFYRFENNASDINLINKTQPEYLKTKLNGMSKKEQAIYRFENMTPNEFLAKKKGIEPTKDEVSILEYLLVDVGLNPGVVNVLMDYVLATSDNKLVRSYIESKASEWQRCGIETVTDAMEKAKSEKKARTKKAVVNKPVWFDKKVEASVVSKEEEQAFLEELKNME